MANLLAALPATILLAALPVTFPLAAATGAAPVEDRGDYAARILDWREDREERLKADGGWLTVAGLFWFEEGENRFGTGPDNAIVLPKGSAPEKAGVFLFHDGKTTVRIAEGVNATVDDRPVSTMEMQADSTGTPDVLALNGLRMHVIQRGDRYGIRLKDMNSSYRREFTGLNWYPVDEAYRLTVRFVPYDPPESIAIPTVLGTTIELSSPGYVVFTLGGREIRLDPVLEEPDDDRLFFIFGDATSGEETYPAGRFLYSAMPEEGVVVLDFNKAYTPPCAFTPHATCPLPPEQNRLPSRSEAGELDYGRH